MKILSTAALIASLAYSGGAFATVFTSTSLSGVDVTTVGISTIGGVVADLQGLNGTHVITQLAASTLFEGFSPTNLLQIGVQTGFNSTVTSTLGGGLTSASFRFTLFDGDTAAGDFDFNDNTLEINGLNFGNWSTTNAQQTDQLGSVGGWGFSNGGFRNTRVDTGWFGSMNTSLLGNLFTSLISSEQLTFVLNDVDPNDNYYDFTQGIDNSLINIGQGPVVIPGGSSVPEVNILALLGVAVAGFGFSRKKMPNEWGEG